MPQSKLEAIKEKNYYEILNVARDARVEDIKESYKEIAKLYHPDSNFYAEIIQDALSEEETEIFKIITLAYTTLSHPEKRAEYDAQIPKGLKGWEDEDIPWEHTPKTVKPQSADISEFQSPGTINLERLRALRPTRPASTPAAPTRSSATLSPALVIGLGLAVGLCLSMALILFW